MKKLLLFFAFTILLQNITRAQSPEIQQLQKKLPDIQDSARYVDALNRIGILLYEKNIDSTFSYSTRAREIAGRLGYEKGEADAIENLGIFYDIKGNIPLALRYYDEAYNRYKALRDSAEMVTCVMNIAGVYNETGKDEKAILNFKKAISLGRKLKRDSVLGLVIYNYLLEYPQNTSADSVTYYINKAKNIGTKYKDTRLLLVLDQLIADNDFRNNQREKGLALLKNTIDRAMANNFYYLSLDILIDIGDKELPADTAKGLKYYKEALSIAEQKEYLIYCQTLARKLYDFYAAHHDYVTAYFYSDKLLKFRDRQDKINNASGIDYLDYAVKEQQLAASKTRSRYETIFLILMVVVCVVTVAAIVVLWRNWKKTISTEKALRLQFEQTEQDAEALDAMNKNYARLIKIVAHDLRNPLAAMGTIAELIADKKPGDEINELVKLMQTSVDNSLKLINELLKTDFNRQIELNNESFGVDELLEQSVRLLTFRAKDKKQELVLRNGTRAIITADKEKIWRVVNNLIVNAIKFSPEGSKIIIESEQKPGMVLISVKDAGIGVPAEIHEKIFDPFTSARRSGTDGEKPFGLGLYISKQIIEAHGGKIGLKSQPGDGSEFFIELPV